MCRIRGGGPGPRSPCPRRGALSGKGRRLLPAGYGTISHPVHRPINGSVSPQFPTNGIRLSGDAPTYALKLTGQSDPPYLTQEGEVEISLTAQNGAMPPHRPEGRGLDRKDVALCCQADARATAETHVALHHRAGAAGGIRRHGGWRGPKDRRGRMNLKMPKGMTSGWSAP